MDNVLKKEYGCSEGDIRLNDIEYPDGIVW
jgi:hypothetical protein